MTEQGGGESIGAPRPTIEEQRSALAQIQMAHMDELKAHGVIDVANRHYGAPFDGVQYLVGQVSSRYDDRLLQLVMARYRVDDKDGESRSFTHFTIGRELMGEVRPERGFEPKQAELVRSQLDQLSDLQQQGSLPNLNESLTGIIDPSSGLRSVD